MSKMLRPTYVWRMATGLLGWGDHEDRPIVKSARTRARNAQDEIDALVLRRAETIRAEKDLE